MYVYNRVSEHSGAWSMEHGFFLCNGRKSTKTMLHAPFFGAKIALFCSFFLDKENSSKHVDVYNLPLFKIRIEHAI